MLKITKTPVPDHPTVGTGPKGTFRGTISATNNRFEPTA